MFYSHEVLTSRKYGVATVWLVATLGQRSSLKRLTRKTISEVDIPKACQSIAKPAAPMALRLTSSLLYGVSRVYNQQCDYVLSDAQQAQNGLRALLRVVKKAGLDPKGSKTKFDQLLIPDDPTFMPDFNFESLDVDLFGISKTGLGDSQLRSLSIHSLPPPGLLHPVPLLRYDSSPAGPLDLPMPESATSHVSGFGGITLAQEGELLPDLDMEIDEEGNLVQIPLPTQGTPEVTAVRPMLSSEARQRVRAEHVGGAGLEDEFAPVFEGDTNLPFTYDLPEAGMLSSPARQPPVSSVHPSSPEAEPSSTSAPLRRRARTKKAIPLDSTLELRTRDLKDWNENYLKNMVEADRITMAKRATQQARKNAEFWVFTSGLNNVGHGIGNSKAKSPLDVFSGPNLLEWITGRPQGAIPQKRRSSEEAAGDAKRGSPRRRSEGSQVGRGAEETGLFFAEGDDEMPREAAEALEDVSSAMPWNISASLRGSSVAPVPAGSVSAISEGRARSISVSARRRLVSASPLVGRGRVSGLEIGPGIDPLLAAASSDMPGFDDGTAGPMDIEPSEFEIHGPAAFVDTQTAAQASWQRAALDQESGNFLEFVTQGLNGMRQDAVSRGDGDGDIYEVDFEALLPPATNSNVVAAQAFLHVLTLASKGLLGVSQPEDYGPIGLQPL